MKGMYNRWKAVHLHGPTSAVWGDLSCTADWSYSRQQLHQVGHTAGELWWQCFVGPLHLLQLCYLFDLLLVHSEGPHHSLRFGSVQMQSLSTKIKTLLLCASAFISVYIYLS
jgi:hypothetical protein